MCGKDLVEWFVDCVDWGSPPRVREGPNPGNRIPELVRITPACAGRTHKVLLRRYLVQDHPRVCGKDFVSFLKTYPQPGSPPRVREGLSKFAIVRFFVRITPARAGRTLNDCRISLDHRDHPRSRGKDFSGLVMIMSRPGSPPLAREGRVLHAVG